MRKEHNAKLHILKALSDSDFHSGEALGESLGKEVDKEGKEVRISLMPIAMYSGYHWEALAVGLSYIAFVLFVWRFVFQKSGQLVTE